jgi:hypothetical protein
METAILPEPEAIPAISEDQRHNAPKIEPGAYIVPTVGAALFKLIRHPIRHLLRRWNWKSALLSSILRASIFFCTNLVAGWHAAMAAMLAELMLRGITSGFYGAVTEALSEARPAWSAMVSAMVVLPILNHSLEFLVHWLRGTPKLGLSITTSVFFTAFSTAFNLYIMRHGVLTVGGGSGPLRQDLARIFPLLGRFLLAGPRALLHRITIESNSK